MRIPPNICRWAHRSSYAVASVSHFTEQQLFGFALIIPYRAADLEPIFTESPASLH